MLGTHIGAGPPRRVFSKIHMPTGRANIILLIKREDGSNMPHKLGCTGWPPGCCWLDIGRMMPCSAPTLWARPGGYF